MNEQRKTTRVLELEERLGADFIEVYMTAESEDVAVHMATTLVKERLVACANVNTGTRSIYEWDGVIQLENEVTVIMKTTIDHVEKIVDRVKEMHSYQVPCITVTDIMDGNPDYLEWVHKQVS
jgi:periplasmic divalent cation tolerance protein